MQLRNKIFDKYYSVHGKFLDEEIGGRQRWFDNLCEANYARYIPSLREVKILEIGCGKGYILKWLQSKGYFNIEGVDLSPEDIEIAKKYVGIDSIYCVNAIEYLSTRENTYDCIMGKDILEHIEKNELDESLDAIRRALKPNGRIIIQVPNMDWIMASHERYMDLTHEVGFTRESLGELLRLYFENVSVFPVEYDFPSSIRSKIAFKVIRPVIIKLVQLLLKVLGGGAESCLFQHREILGIGIKR